MTFTLPASPKEEKNHNKQKNILSSTKCPTLGKGNKQAFAKVTSRPAPQDDIKTGIKAQCPSLVVINAGFRARSKEFSYKENWPLFHLNLSSFQEDFTLEGERKKKACTHTKKTLCHSLFFPMTSCHFQIWEPQHQVAGENKWGMISLFL